jgi:hypothetical protein
MQSLQENSKRTKFIQVFLEYLSVFFFILHLIVKSKKSWKLLSEADN